MRWEITDHAWTAIKPFLPNNPRVRPSPHDANCYFVDKIGDGGNHSVQ
jgi:transposase